MASVLTLTRGGKKGKMKAPTLLAGQTQESEIVKWWCPSPCCRPHYNGHRCGYCGTNMIDMEAQCVTAKR